MSETTATGNYVSETYRVTIWRDGRVVERFCNPAQPICEIIAARKGAATVIWS